MKKKTISKKNERDEYDFEFYLDSRVVYYSECNMSTVFKNLDLILLIKSLLLLQEKR